MKCPVCDQENPSMLCPRCGFDSSRDYEHYPTFGIIGNVPAISALQAERDGGRRITAQEKQQLLDRVAELERQMRWAVAEIHRLQEKLGISDPSAAAISTSRPMPSVDMVEKNKMPNRLRDNPLRTLLSPFVDNRWQFVFDSKVWREQIGSVTFLSTLANVPENAWDESADKNGSIRSWVVPKGELYDLYLAADGEIEAPESCKGMFSGFRNMSRIHFGNCLRTSMVKNMSHMFSGCSSLKKLDLSSFDTAKVQDMGSMFSGCSSLTALDLSSFNTSKVLDMANMFLGCSSLTALDLSSFNTSKVLDMASMFYNCSSLTALDLSSFDTSKVQNMYSMFSGGSSLTALNLSSFNTARTSNMGCMFSHCSSLAALDLSSFDTTKVLDMSSMFSYCKSLTKLDLSHFNTAKVQDMRYMFKGCKSLTTLTRTQFFTTANAKTVGMLDGCPAGKK